MFTSSPRPSPGPRRAIARERSADYGDGSVLAVLDRHLATPIDELDQAQIRDELELNETALRRLHARNAELAAALVRRQARRNLEVSPGDMHAGQKATRAVTDELRTRLQWTPSRTKQALRTADQLAGSPGTREAFRDGTISSDHARVLADTLQHLDREERDRVELELVTAAEEQDPVTFGRTCRATLADLNAAAAERAADRRHRQRYARASQDPDGVWRLSAALSGIPAETVATALEAFRTTDRIAGDERTPDQRAADALYAMARAALDHGAPPTAHGQRPHVTVHVTWADLVAGTGNAEATWTGPVPTSEVRRLLDDSTISRVVTGPDSLPLDTGRATRTVAPAIWRTLVARDRHCTVPGCSAPPARCQAAHLDRRWFEGAGVSADELALVCYDDHPKIDRQGWRGQLIDGRVVWHPPQRRPSGPPPREGPAPSDPPPPAPP